MLSITWTGPEILDKMSKLCFFICIDNDTADKLSFGQKLLDLTNFCDLSSQRHQLSRSCVKKFACFEQKCIVWSNCQAWLVLDLTLKVDVNIHILVIVQDPTINDNDHDDDADDDDDDDDDNEHTGIESKMRK